MIFLDRSVTFWHGILGSECHVFTWYYLIGVSHPDTIWLDRKVTCGHDNSKGITYWINEMYSISYNSVPQILLLEAWVLMDDLDIVDLLYTYFSVVDTCLCCLSCVKFYSWVHPITHCILVSILGWPMIPTQYMLPRTESYLCFSFLFSFYGVQCVYQLLWLALRSS